jgi:hypothetical protein
VSNLLDDTISCCQLFESFCGKRFGRRHLILGYGAMGDAVRSLPTKSRILFIGGLLSPR